MKLHIAEMLRAQKKHISFHTPGHKRAGADITELPYSDCLVSPTGVLAAAERDVAEILGAARSFLLTDGSTCGVFSMVGAMKARGVKKIAVSAFSHPSVFHACEALGVATEPVMQDMVRGFPVQPSPAAIEDALEKADALLLTSPDYYGFFAPLAEARKLCDERKKPLAVDGAHGSHLHFCENYAGKYADLWVDGVHKSLPAMTQGAVVSANAGWAEALSESVVKFRTTSPSYPIMASVEYAVKFPRNEAIERAAEAAKRDMGALSNADWTKIVVPFADTGAAERSLEARGVYPEFNDGNYLMFYLSPCTKARELKKLVRLTQNLPRRDVAEDAPAGAIPMYRLV